MVCARRGGLSATFDELNKFFTISGMPVASSQYWNSIHGREAGEAALDAEGLQIMRALARNMTFLMKSIALGKEAYGLPEKRSIHKYEFYTLEKFAGAPRFTGSSQRAFPITVRPGGSSPTPPMRRGRRHTKYPLR